MATEFDRGAEPRVPQATIGKAPNQCGGIADPCVSMHDPQLRANTLDGIVRTYKGKMCVRLDLDEQMFPFSTPDVPLENMEAILAAMEEFRTYWWDGRG